MTKTKLLLMMATPLIIIALCMRQAFGAPLNQDVIKTATAGDFHAQYTLGKSYYNGEQGGRKDPTRAFQWFLKAAKQGHIEASFCVGVLYDKGEGVKQNKVEALKWYRIAGSLGHSKAQFNAGEMLYEGYGVNRSLGEAIFWFKKAAEQNEARGQYRLGLAYLEGKGLETNEDLAKVLLAKAALQGHKDAIHTLALLREAENEGNRNIQH